MNIIEEIEADAQVIRDFFAPPHNPNDGTFNNACNEADAFNLVESKYWPRIKAALEAARKMDGTLTVVTRESNCPYEGVWPSQQDFREAMGEVSRIVNTEELK